MIDQLDPGAATRKRIVLAAMELFWEKGYQSTSVADLLKRAEVHSGSLYHFFAGKQDVLLAVLHLYHERHRRDVARPRVEGRRRSDRARVRAAREVSRADCRDRLHLRLSDRQPRARIARARSAGACAARSQFHGLGGRDRAAASSMPGARLPRGVGPARTRRVRADDDGGRRDARPHVSGCRDVRRDRWPAPRLSRPPARAGRAPSDHPTQTQEGDRNDASRCLMLVLPCYLSLAAGPATRVPAGCPLPTTGVRPGSCWKGTFPDGKQSRRALLRMGLRRAVLARPAHGRRRARSPYGGETIYYFDAAIEDRALPLHQHARRQQSRHGHGAGMARWCSPRTRTAMASSSRPIEAPGGAMATTRISC